MKENTNLRACFSVLKARRRFVFSFINNMFCLMASVITTILVVKAIKIANIVIESNNILLPFWLDNELATVR